MLLSRFRCHNTWVCLRSRFMSLYQLSSIVYFQSCSHFPEEERLRLSCRWRRKDRPQFRLNKHLSGLSLLILDLEDREATLVLSARRCMMKFIVQRPDATNVARKGIFLEVVDNSSNNSPPTTGHLNLLSLWLGWQCEGQLSMGGERPRRPGDMCFSWL